MDALERFPEYRTDLRHFHAAVAHLRAGRMPPSEIARAVGVLFPADAVSVEDAVNRAGTSWDRFAILCNIGEGRVRQVCARRSTLLEREQEQVRALLGADLPWRVERKPWAAVLDEHRGESPREVLEAAGYTLVDAPTLREALERSCIPRARFAQVLGVHPTQVSQWVNEVSAMTPHFLGLIQQVFPGVRNTKETSRSKTRDNPWAQAFAAAGLTQTQVAQALGITTPLVNHWCTGRSKPAAHHLPKLQALVGGALPPPPPSDLDVLLDWLESKGLLDEAVAYMESRRG